jgi:hypothetical protein
MGDDGCRPVQKDATGVAMFRRMIQPSLMKPALLAIALAATSALVQVPAGRSSISPNLRETLEGSGFEDAIASANAPDHLESSRIRYPKLDTIARCDRVAISSDANGHFDQRALDTILQAALDRKP